MGFKNVLDASLTKIIPSKMQQLSNLLQGDDRSFRNRNAARLLHILEEGRGQLGVDSGTVAGLTHHPELIRGAERL